MDKNKIAVIRHLLRIGAVLQREGNRVIGEFGLNQQQFVVLKEIEEKGTVSQKDICSVLLFEKSNVSKIIKKLAEGGLIAVTNASKDRRVSRVAVTEKGEKAVARCMAKLDAWNERWLKALSAREMAETVKVLGRLNAPERKDAVVFGKTEERSEVDCALFSDQ